MRGIAVAGALTLTVAAGAAAQQAGPADAGAAEAVAGDREATGGFLFEYRPREGRRAAFEEGYRRHLDWHRARKDSLAWFGWDVMAGPGLGNFVDGVFGIRFATLDARVDPAGDAADAAENVTPHAEPTARQLVRLRRDLSTATPLEDGTPRRLVEVVRYRVTPAGLAGLAQAFGALRRTSGSDALLPYTVYETVAGAPPGFLLMVWRDGLGSFDAADRDPARALRAHLSGRGAGPEDGKGAVTAGPADPVVTSEVWLFRPDLTYTGPEGGSEGR